MTTYAQQDLSSNRVAEALLSCQAGLRRPPQWLCQAVLSAAIIYNGVVRGTRVGDGFEP